MLNKNFKYYFVIWAILFVVFNAVLFIVAANTGAIAKSGVSFWVTYALIIVSFVAQLLCARNAFSGDSRKLFYGLPMIQVSYSGLIASIIVGAILMSVRVIPCWIAAVICLIIAAIEAVAIVKAKAAADIVSNRDAEIRQKTSFIREMTAEAEMLYKTASTDEEKRELKKLYEVFRYSDPVTLERVFDLESSITQKMAVIKSNYSGTVVNEIYALLNKRNQLIKNQK